MSGLFGSLTSGVQAINAQASALELAGKNLANVNNPNYSRQKVVFGDRGTVLTPQGPQSLGLEAVGVTHLRDKLMDEQLIREISASADLTSLTNSLQQAEAALGEKVDRTNDGSDLGASSSGSGLGDALNSFFAEFHTVANHPTNVSGRRSLIAQAEILSDRFNLVDGRLEALQDGLSGAVIDETSAANDILSSIAKLNLQIGRAEVGHPGAAVDLRDQRQALLEKLGGYISFDSEVSSTDASQLDIVTQDAQGNDITLVSLGVVSNELSVVDGVPSAGDPAVALDLKGGSIKGKIDARDGAIQELRDSLDITARQLVTAVNGIYNPDGTAGLDFFDPAGLSAGTITVASELSAATMRTSSTGSTGGNDILLELGQLFDHSFSVADGDLFEGSLNQYYSTTVATFGQAVAGAEDRLSDQENIEELVRGQRDSVSGVSLDEEMVDLMRYQRAFQASARVVQIVDELLDVIVNRLALR